MVALQRAQGPTLTLLGGWAILLENQEFAQLGRRGEIYNLAGLFIVKLSALCPRWMLGKVRHVFRGVCVGDDGIFFFSKSFDVPMDAIRISRALIGCGDSANPLGFHFNNFTQKFELTLPLCMSKVYNHDCSGLWKGSEIKFESPRPSCVRHNGVECLAQSCPELHPSVHSILTVAVLIKRSKFNNHHMELRSCGSIKFTGHPGQFALF